MPNGKWGTTKTGSTERIILEKNKLKPLRKSLHGSEGLRKARKRGQKTLNRIDRLVIHRREQTHSLNRSRKTRKSDLKEEKTGKIRKGSTQRWIRRTGSNLREINKELRKDNKTLEQQVKSINLEKKKINTFLLKEQKQGRLKAKKMFKL